MHQYIKGFSHCRHIHRIIHKCLIDVGPISGIHVCLEKRGPPISTPILLCITCVALSNYFYWSCCTPIKVNGESGGCVVTSPFTATSAQSRTGDWGTLVLETGQVGPASIR